MVETHLTRETVSRLTTGWYSQSYHSTFSSSSRGVSVLIHNSVDFTLIESYIDDQGRFIFLHGKLHGYSYILAFFYIPPPFSMYPLIQLTLFFEGRSECRLVLMGDFNAVMDPNKDRFTSDAERGRSLCTSPLPQFCLEVGLVDIWEHLGGVVMATAPQLMNTTLSPVNTTAKSQEQILYQSAGAIVAAIVVGVIIIFSLVLVTLKMYNRRTRTERELAMKSTKTTNTPSTRAHNSSISQPTSLTSVPPDIHLENR
ncbi:noncompact myelin-associated protein isoform X1 [Bufo gargarizans]|uniref:noncompact myelin-associated protein isoform X1 n=2 Tax=Bufo gargarizans TaxID=30331 RepID=UPI001CF58A85|nr:noncompact myelin-associated protein isoform X1 [Bufo gargarizans]